MKEHIFADGIGSVAVIGGTVRLSLVVLSPTEKEANGAPKAVPQQYLVMSVPAFLQAAAKIQETVEAIGKLSTASQRPAAAATDAASVSSVNPKPPFP